jgi:hypothetical protein
MQRAMKHEQQPNVKGRIRMHRIERLQSSVDEKLCTVTAEPTH